MKNNIPVFYACDDAFFKFTAVSIRSLVDNSSDENDYTVYVLNGGMPDALIEEAKSLSKENVKIVFVDVSERMENISEKLPIRDYYNNTTYFRLFIADLFPEYDKAIYIDSDTIVQGDVAELYAQDPGDSLVGACHEQAMVQTGVYGDYVEQVVGVSRYNYFNAGVLLINCRRFRECSVLEKFFDRLNSYNFVVTQDEDYLNLICKDHVHWLDQRWNTEVYGDIGYPVEEAKILHYIMVNKPWHYADCLYGDIFWKYAERTSFYGEIKKVLESYTDEERSRDEQSMYNLMELAKSEIERDDNYQDILDGTVRAKDRVEILKKIAQYEREGRFDEDVENDPPSRAIMPDEIEYATRDMKQKAKTKLAFAAARKFVNTLIKEKKLIIKEIKGIENFRDLDSGAIITCNHFNAFDSFAMQLAYDASNQTNREFYRVIREGNYTSFPGFYGYLMRNCNTLPIPSNIVTMKKFMRGVDTLLKDGHFVLVYPEQSMWWNYRKPKPLKSGAYIFAYRNDVPVLPCFITMKDSDILGDDGYFIQEYTIHVCPPIYADKSLNYRASVKDLMDKNYAVWKEIYEREYSMPLVYTSGENQESN